MPASVVLVHDEPNLVEEATTALEAQGYSVAAFLDPLRALDAIERAEKVELLITRMTFAPGKPNGVSLARMTQRRKRGVRVIFIGEPETRCYADGLGGFIAVPVATAELLEEVNRVLRFSVLRLVTALRMLRVGREKEAACTVPV